MVVNSDSIICGSRLIIKEIIMSKKRQYTNAEMKRLEYFNKLEEDLTNAGYNKKDLTFSALKANIEGVLYGVLLTIPFIVAFLLLRDSSKEFTDFDKLMFSHAFIVVFLVLIVIHELIHGATWGIFATNHYKSISLGVMLSSLTPYCTCREPLKKSHYITGTIMPCLVLGIIPSVIAVIISSMGLLAVGLLMIVTAGGDILVIILLLKNKASENAIYIDHPTDIGLVVFDK